jgi:DNA-binding NarL/FixJ family response regulator
MFMETWRTTSGESPIRVVLADDHTLVLEAFKTFLAGQVEVVARPRTGAN